MGREPRQLDRFGRAVGAGPRHDLDPSRRLFAHDRDDALVFDSRGGNNLLLDDEKLAALSKGVIPAAEAGDAPVVIKEGVPKALTKPFHSYWDSTTVDYAFRRIKTRTPEQFADVAIASAPLVAKAKGDVATWPVGVQ